MVQFVMTSWSQPCSAYGPIVPETESPKKTPRTLTMVVLHISQINAIEYYEKLANVLVITNMPLIFSNDARIIQIEIKNRGELRETYIAYGGLIMLGLDPGSLCEWPGIDWDNSRVLKLPLTWTLISNFFVNFCKVVMPLPTIFNPYFVSFSLLM